MEDVTKSAYAEWLEEFIKSIMEFKPEKIGVCALLPDGGTLTAYYGAGIWTKLQWVSRCSLMHSWMSQWQMQE